MTEKKLLQDYAENILVKEFQRLGIKTKGEMPLYHVNSGAYRFKRGKKNFPDLLFAYNGQVYMWEFGIPKSHMDRKAEQFKYMLSWHKHGGIEFRMLFDRRSIIEEFQNMGIKIER